MSMINELIDRLRTEAKSMGSYGTNYIATLLMKAADTIEMLSKKTREPKQGKWIHDRLETDGAKLTDLFLPLCQCSECSIYVQYESNFCPHCGTRMKGTDE